MTPLSPVQRFRLLPITLLYFVFVIYGSLVPLNYVAIPLDAAIERFVHMPFLDLGIVSRADWVANLLLFIPLSFLLAECFVPQRSPLIRQVLRALIFFGGLGLALGIEFTQTFFPPRTVSQNDILAETLGGGLGLILQAALGQPFRTLLAAWARHESQQSRIDRLLQAWIGGLLLFSVLPLDLTLSPVELYHKLSEGRLILIPFGSHHSHWSDFLYETLTDILIWVPPGLWWARKAFSEKRRPLAYALTWSLIASTLIEGAQLFVYSRVTDVTDILMAGVGALIGAMLAGKLRQPLSLPGQSTGKALLLFPLWLLGIGGVFWYPFDFNPTLIDLPQALDQLMRVPFVTYYYGTEFHATNELLRKMGFFLPGGVLWALSFPPRQRRSRLPWLAFALIATAVELGQAWLPGKISDITDIVLEMLGAMAGLHLTAWILSGNNSGSSNNAFQPTSPPPLAPSNKPPRPRPGTPRSSAPTPGWRPVVTSIALLSAAIWGLCQLPFIPYNIRELLPSPPLESLLAAVALATLIYGSCNPRFIGHFLSKPWGAWALPLLLMAHGVIAWTLLRSSVPLESIHDIIGSPVLDWPWEWEMVGRFILLDMVIMMQVLGGYLTIARRHQHIRLEQWLLWLCWNLLLAWPLYYGTVDQAATDNLVELMADQASFFSASLLALGALSLFISASTLSHLSVMRQRPLHQLMYFFLYSGIATACLWWGSESLINKYEQTFSAWQFLLSTDRSHYAEGLQLWGRYAVASLGIQLLVAWCQREAWKK